MVAVPISQAGEPSRTLTSAVSPRGEVRKAHNRPDWTHFLAAGTIIAGGALIAAGRRRTGLAVAATGTALALLEEQDVVKEWWRAIPGYLNDAQGFLDRIEHYLQEASVQGQRIQNILKR
jgi:hypothetical protein